MKFTYDGSGRFWHGLPARDLDDAELDEGAKATLEAAVAAGAYAPVAVPTKEKPHGSDATRT